VEAVDVEEVWEAGARREIWIGEGEGIADQVTRIFSAICDNASGPEDLGGGVLDTVFIGGVSCTVEEREGAVAGKREVTKNLEVFGGRVSDDAYKGAGESEVKRDCLAGERGNAGGERHNQFWVRLCEVVGGPKFIGLWWRVLLK